MTSKPRLVAAVDFSKGSTDAVKWAVKWLLSERELVLAHVLVLPQSDRSVSRSLLDNARVGARRRLDDLRKSLGIPGAKIEVVEGKPGEAIARVSQSLQADIVVVGKHGEGGPLKGYTGRTADALVRSSPVPTLVVNGVLSSAPRRIIVALTYSSITPHVVEWTRRMHEASGAQIRIVHVVNSGTLGHVLSMSAIRTGETPTPEQVDEIFLEDRQRWMQMLVDAGIPEDHVESEVVFGEVSTAILAAQSARGADMIIMGSHAGPVRRLLLGSAASAVIRNAEVPVLVVVEPAPVDEKEELHARVAAGAGEAR